MTMLELHRSRFVEWQPSAVVALAVAPGGATVALCCVGLRKRLFARGRAPAPDLGPPAWLGYRRVGPPLLNL